MKPPDAVVCYWSWIHDHSDPYARRWRMDEAHGLDEDGHFLTTPSTGGKDRHDWENWLGRKKSADEDEIDWEPIPGRCVTMWSWLHGVRLTGLVEPVPNLCVVPGFFGMIGAFRNWSQFVTDGHVLYIDTARVAKMIVVGQKVQLPFRSRP